MKRFRISVFELCFYSILGTVIFVLKMAMAALPNIEPVSFFVILTSVVFGWPGYLAIMIYIALEYLTFGLQLWSINYLYVWLVLFAVARCLRKMDSALGYAVLSGFFGLSFGALCALVYIFIGGWSLAFTWWLSGIPFDLLHCAGNFVLMLLLYKPVRAVFEKIKKRMELHHG